MTSSGTIRTGDALRQGRDGSGNLTKQFIHGTQYIDELLMVRVMNKGEFYVHQDANWNVVALTNLRGSAGGAVVERYVYTPYGEVNVMQATSFGDRDGDEDVDSTDKGTVGTTCNSTPVTGECRILDLDFDGDYDSTDAGFFDYLPQGVGRHPGKFASGVDQPFHHQGLLFEPEVRQYQNRARQYVPTSAKFGQRDRIGYSDSMSLYEYIRSQPISAVDPSGELRLDLILGAVVTGIGFLGDIIFEPVPSAQCSGPLYDGCDNLPNGCKSKVKQVCAAINSSTQIPSWAKNCMKGRCGCSTGLYAKMTVHCSNDTSTAGPCAGAVGYTPVPGAPHATYCSDFSEAPCQCVGNILHEMAHTCFILPESVAENIEAWASESVGIPCIPPAF